MKASPREMAAEIMRLQERVGALEARQSDDVEKRLEVTRQETDRAHQNIAALSARMDERVRRGWPKGKPRGPRKPLRPAEGAGET